MKTEDLKILQQRFEAETNENNAKPMKKYMKNLFDYFGIQTPLRKEIGAAFMEEKGLPAKEKLDVVIKELWRLPQREFQYFALDVLEKIIKKSDKDIIALLEYLIVTKSWWDTVDRIAQKLVGALFQKYPELIAPHTTKWMASENIWLQRTALLFQLRYKKKTNVDLLFRFIHQLAASDEFFIQKAIGWALREYSKTDAEKVITFIGQNTLAPLSVREGLKVINKKKSLA